MVTVGRNMFIVSWLMGLVTLNILFYQIPTDLLINIGILVSLIMLRWYENCNKYTKCTYIMYSVPHAPSLHMSQFIVSLSLWWTVIRYGINFNNFSLLVDCFRTIFILLQIWRGYQINLHYLILLHYYIDYVTVGWQSIGI